MTEGEQRHRYRNELQFYTAIGGGIFFDFIAIAQIVRTIGRSGSVQMYVILFYVALLVGLTIVASKMALATVIASPNGVHVVNTFSSFDLAWEQIDRFDLGRYGKVMSEVCRIHTRDGRVLPAIAVQENHIGGGSAVRMVEELNKELAEQRGEPAASS